MTGSQPRVLAVLVAVATVVGFAVVRAWERSGGASMPLPWAAVVAMAAIAVSVLALAWPVRRWNAGDRARPLDPLRAARAAVLAKAASHCGALVSGWYLGQALVLAPDMGLGPRRDRLLVAGVAVLAGIGVLAAGLVAERWCRLPDDPDDELDDDPDDGLGGFQEHL